MRDALIVALGTLVACSSPHSMVQAGEDASGGSNTPDAAQPPGDGSGSGSGSSSTAAFKFGIVGDTRPANEDDTTNYPTAVITKIWQDVAGANVQFAISTGDYMFASTTGSQQNPQLDLYLGARAQYTGTVYPAMGNHECTGATASNCGSGTTDGVTKNYSAFMTRMIQPLGFSDPYYVVNVNDPNGQWTAKLVVIAGNAWTSAQSSWLDAALSVPTTYTFVVRHEGIDATTAPGVSPSDTIIAKHPYTLLIVGHTHTYRHYASDHELINGNGGAPLTSGTNYGYGVLDRRTDGTIEFTEHDYQTNAITDTWAVTPTGTYATP